MRTASVLALLLIAFAPGCRAQRVFKTEIQPDATFSRGQPTAEELERFELAARYSREEDGRALLILRGQDVVFEDYANGHKPETPWHLYSGTKTFAGVLALAAIADGILDLDELVSDTLPELRTDPMKAKIRVRHLLRFTSGLAPSYWLAYDATRETQYVPDKYARALDLVIDSEPGKRWRYGNGHLLLFAAFMRRKLGEDPLAYLERRVFEPIGFRYAGWHRDAVGNPMFSLGCWTTAWEWAKFGVFLRDRGRWKGKQIIPDELFDEMFQGSDVMPAYGITCWLMSRKVPAGMKPLGWFRSLAKREGDSEVSAAPGVIAAAGLQNQRLFVIPARDLVVVRLAEGELSYRDAEFLSLLLGLEE